MERVDFKEKGGRVLFIYFNHVCIMTLMIDVV